MSNIQNTVDAIRCLLADAGMNVEFPFDPGERRVTVQIAQAQLMDLVRVYDTMAPDWSKLPKEAEWYAVDANGDAYAYAEEPRCVPDLGEWQLQGWHGWQTSAILVGVKNNRIGIDWQECIWKRPDA